MLTRLRLPAKMLHVSHVLFVSGILQIVLLLSLALICLDASTRSLWETSTMMLEGTRALAIRAAYSVPILGVILGVKIGYKHAQKRVDTQNYAHCSEARIV